MDSAEVAEAAMKRLRQFRLDFPDLHQQGTEAMHDWADGCWFQIFLASSSGWCTSFLDSRMFINVSFFAVAGIAFQTIIESHGKPALRPVSMK